MPSTLTPTDPDADEKYAPNHGAHDDLGVSPEDASKEVADLEKMYAADGDTKADTDSDKPLADREAEAADDTVGKGFTKAPAKGLTAKLTSSSSFKKKLALAGAAAGGSVIAGILIFILLLPMKLSHIVHNLQGNFSASANEATDQEMSNLFETYITTKVFVNMGGTKRCHSTIDIGCVSPSDSKSPVGRTFNAWKDARLENKLAKDYGLEFGRNGSTYFIKTEGKVINLKDGESIFNSADGKEATRGEIRRIVNQRLKEGTLYDRVILYTKVWPFLEHKYGIKRCIIACDTRDRFNDSIANKKLAGKAYIINRVMGPMNESYGLILQCVMAGSRSSGCNTDLNGNEDVGSESERNSEFHQKLREQLVSYRARFGADALDKLLKDADILSEKGIAGFMFEKVFGELGGTVAKESLDKAIPIVGWINFGAKAVDFVATVGPKLKAYNYAASSAAAVALFSMYATTSNELQTGHIDATQFGSVINTLGDDSNLDGKGSDMTNSPAYGPLMGETSKVGSGNYKCNDGTTPTGVVCEEEKLNGGNKAATALSNAANSIPGFDVIKAVADAWNSTAGAILDKLGGAIAFLAQYIPGLSSLEQAISSFVQPLMQYVINWILPNPFAGNVSGANVNDGNVSGGRLFDMAAAGADVMGNKQCQVVLGCAKQSDVATAAARNRYIAANKRDFQSQTFFARMFDTKSPYSFISHVAMATPTNIQVAAHNGMASMLSNPFGKVGSVLSGIFSGPHTFAATGAMPDPFGVTQYGYDAKDIPKNPETYWDANCVNGPVATYDDTTGKLNVDAWLDKQQQDPESGEGVATETNPCLLILTTSQGGGGMFDSKMLPVDDIDNAPATSTTGTGGTATAGGNAGDGDDYGDACYRGIGSKYGVSCSGQCVDFVVYRLNKHVKANGLNWGFPTGASVVPTLGSKYGYTTDHTPAVHSVASWPAGGVNGPSGTAGSAGHTAMVAAVTNDSAGNLVSITVEDYNWGHPGLQYHSHVIPAATASQLTYAHVEKDYK
jgi:surface antigen